MKDIKLIIYDFDGVFTDNRVILREDGLESVIVNRADGLAVSIFKKRGIKQVILSTETNRVVEARAKKLDIPVVRGIQNKKEVLINYCEKLNISLKDVVYIGNDINDLESMKIVGYPICPADAYKEVKEISKIVLDVPGGGGVARSLMNYFNEK